MMELLVFTSTTYTPVANVEISMVVKLVPGAKVI